MKETKISNTSTRSKIRINEHNIISNYSEDNGAFSYIKPYVEEAFYKRFPKQDFLVYWIEYNNLPDFKISDNVEVAGGISEEAHYIMRIITEYYMTQAFKAMKVDMTDANVAGEKGTPYRITKMYCGNGLDDDTELLSGRWSKRPEMATFPNESEHSFPITKRVDIVSVCSHHLAPFSTLFKEDAYAIISYIPGKKVLGISKLQRIVDWVARRGHLQENLTKMIFDEVKKAAQTESVYVKLHGLMHTCESLRGAQSKDGSFSSEYYCGDYNNIELRREINSK